MDPGFVVVVFALIFRGRQGLFAFEDKADDGVVSAGTAVTGRTFPNAADIGIAVDIGQLIGKAVVLDGRADILFGVVLHIGHDEEKGTFVQNVEVFCGASGQKKKQKSQKGEGKKFFHRDHQTKKIRKEGARRQCFALRKIHPARV